MPTELDRSLTLIRTVMDDPRFDDPSYVDWLYDRNPIGPNHGNDLDHDGERIGHIGGVQHLYRKGDNTGVGVLIVNSCTMANERGRGIYPSLVQSVIDRARDEGLLLVHGVTNTAATPSIIKIIKAKHVAALPAFICPPPIARTKHVKSYKVDAAFLDSPEFAEIADDVDRAPAREWTRVWSPEVLRWRLARPGYPYSIHVGREVVAVSVREHSHHLPFAVILKFFPRGALGARRSAADVLTAACKFHRAPLAVYAGRNEFVKPFGFRLKQDWLPAPLNLVALPTNELETFESLDFGTFEFLDFDAY